MPILNTRFFHASSLMKRETANEGQRSLASERTSGVHMPQGCAATSRVKAFISRCTPKCSSVRGAYFDKECPPGQAWSLWKVWRDLQMGASSRPQLST